MQNKKYRFSKEQQESFDFWMEDGNVIKNADGTYSTQDAMYRNRLENMDALKQYFYNEFIKGQWDSYSSGGSTKEKYYIEFLNKEKGFRRDRVHFDSYEEAQDWGRKNLEKFNSDMIRVEYKNGGSLDDKTLVAKAIEYITGSLIEKESISYEANRVAFKYKNKNAWSTLNQKLIEDTIKMHRKSLESRGKFSEGGETNSKIISVYYVEEDNKGEKMKLLSQSIFTEDKLRQKLKQAKEKTFDYIDKGLYLTRHEVYVHPKNVRKPYLDKFKVSFDNYSEGGEVKKILWAVKQGEPDWAEQIITENESRFDEAKKWAEANGFDRFRIAEIDMSKKPKFGKGGNVSSIEKKVAEVNRLIELANEKGISVVDSSSTWQSPMKYKPIRYSNGVLYVEYDELDLYKYNRTGVSNWVTKKDKVLKRDMQFDNPLNDIAKMYRKALKEEGLDYMVKNVKEDKKEVEKDNFDDTGTSMVMYHEKKGNFLVPKGQVYLWLYDVEGSADKLQKEEFDWVFYPYASQTMAWQSGYIPPLEKIWTKKFQKQHKGSEHLLGVVKAYLLDDGKKLFIDMMSVNPTKKKKGIMSYMIKDLRESFNLTQEQVEFSKLTEEGEKFVAKKTYADGGWVLMDSDTERKIGEYETESEARKMMYEYEGNSVIVEKSKWNNYADGGDIPFTEKMFHLPLEMVVYVPSTQDVDNVISVDEMDNRVNEVKTYLAGKFGGYTASDRLGGYVDSKGNLVNEEVVQVVSFSTKEDFETHKEELIKQIAKWGKQWGQEAIGFEFEGDLMYVPQEL
jgi:hypothetical protein